MASLTFCAISGNLRGGSHNTAALRAAAKLAPEGVTIVEENLADIPVYNEDVNAMGYPAAVVRLQQAIASADAVLIANKPMAIMGASSSAFGTARAVRPAQDARLPGRAFAQ